MAKGVGRRQGKGQPGEIGAVNWPVPKKRPEGNFGKGPFNLGEKKGPPWLFFPQFLGPKGFPKKFGVSLGTFSQKLVSLGQPGLGNQKIGWIPLLLLW